LGFFALSLSGTTMNLTFGKANLHKKSLLFLKYLDWLF